jgi:hypothetical protein
MVHRRIAHVTIIYNSEIEGPFSLLESPVLRESRFAVSSAKIPLLSAIADTKKPISPRAIMAQPRSEAG